MRRGGYVAAVVACAAVAAGALAGCQGDGSDPTPSPSQSASNSAPPPSPSESTSASPQGETAEEFISRFVVAQTALLNTGRASEYRALTSAGCRTCKSLLTRVRTIYSAGGSIETEGWSVEGPMDVSGGGKTRSVRLQVVSAPTTLVESAGADPQELGGGPSTQVFKLRRAGSTWTVTEYNQVST